MSDSTPLRVSIVWCGISCTRRWSNRARGWYHGKLVLILHWYVPACRREPFPFKGAVFDVRGEGLCWYAMRKLTKSITRKRTQQRRRGASTLRVFSVLEVVAATRWFAFWKFGLRERSSFGLGNIFLLSCFAFWFVGPSRRKLQRCSPT